MGIFFFIYFYQLEANYFTILQWFLPYIDKNQPWTCVPHPEPPPASFPIPSLWVFPVHQPRALVSCIQPRLVICFTLDNIHVSMLFSQIIPPSPSPIESKSLFYTSVSPFLSCIQGYCYCLSKFRIYALVCCIGVYLSGTYTQQNITQPLKRIHLNQF